MGTKINIVLYAPDAATANHAFQAAFRRIAALEKIMSDYDPESEVLQLCRKAPTPEPVSVSDELCRVLARSLELSERTGGAFDVTVGPLTKLWRRARRRVQLPDEERLQEAKSSVGYHFLRLDERTCKVALLRPNMRIDLGGIAKGFAADEAIAVLKNKGIASALINAGGDITVSEAPPGTTGWKVAVAPLEPNQPPRHILQLCNASIATSGDTWQFVEIDGVRYSHIVDPRTGIGLTTHSSVSVVAPTGLDADGLASAVSVLGPEKGLALIEKTPNTEAMIVQERDGRLATFLSEGFLALEIELPDGNASSP